MPVYLSPGRTGWRTKMLSKMRVTVKGDRVELRSAIAEIREKNPFQM